MSNGSQHPPMVKVGIVVGVTAFLAFTMGSMWLAYKVLRKRRDKYFHSLQPTPFFTLQSDAKVRPPPRTFQNFWTDRKARLMQERTRNTPHETYSEITSFSSSSNAAQLGNSRAHAHTSIISESSHMSQGPTSSTSPRQAVHRSDIQAHQFQQRPRLESIESSDYDGRRRVESPPAYVAPASGRFARYQYGYSTKLVTAPSSSL